jgi:hypothetical protein
MKAFCPIARKDTSANNVPKGAEKAMPVCNVLKLFKDFFCNQMECLSLAGFSSQF